jgi:hypothetical protein
MNPPEYTLKKRHNTRWCITKTFKREYDHYYILSSCKRAQLWWFKIASYRRFQDFI